MLAVLQAKVAAATAAANANGGIIPAGWDTVLNDIIGAVTALEFFMPASWQAGINAIIAAIHALEGNSAATKAKQVPVVANFATPANTSLPVSVNNPTGTVTTK